MSNPADPMAMNDGAAQPPASQPLAGRYLAKLQPHKPFSPEARAAFLALPGQLRTYEANRDIVAEGERPQVSCFVNSGLVSRYKSLPDGGRQIVAFHVAGDMVDLQSALLVVADHGIRTHTRTNIVQFAHADLLRVAGEHPEIARAFWFDTLLDAAIFREWTVNVGRRSARERTAHLLLEFAWKLRAAGLMEGDSFELPISQTDLADALGISPVHLNRTLQWLRAKRLIVTHSRTVILQDQEELIRVAGFNPGYMHPEGPRAA